MQFFKHPNINYFITYTCSYIALGAAITALGPLVPFLAS